jgi:hypothetical protein
MTSQFSSKVESENYQPICEQNNVLKILSKHIFFPITQVGKLIIIVASENGKV